MDLKLPGPLCHALAGFIVISKWTFGNWYVLSSRHFWKLELTAQTRGNFCCSAVSSSHEDWFTSYCLSHSSSFYWSGYGVSGETKVALRRSIRWDNFSSIIQFWMAFLILLRRFRFLEWPFVNLFCPLLCHNFVPFWPLSRRLFITHRIRTAHHRLDDVIMFPRKKRISLQKMNCVSLLAGLILFSRLTNDRSWSYMRLTSNTISWTSHRLHSLQRFRNMGGQQFNGGVFSQRALGTCSEDPAHECSNTALLLL